MNYSVQSWLELYEKNGVFNSSFPSLNIDDNSKLSIVFLIWKNFINELKDKYKSRENIKESDPEKYSLVSNRWIQETLTALNQLSERDNAENYEVKEKLEEFLKETSIKKITVKERIEKLEEFLELPFWNKYNTPTKTNNQKSSLIQNRLK